MLRTLFTALLLLSCLAGWHEAGAQVHRCTAADGTQIFTDRACGDIGASSRLPPPASSGNTGATRAGICHHDVGSLANALAAAVQSGDVNRIAALYDWAGMGTASANPVLDQLLRVAERTLVDVRPLRTASAAETDTPTNGSIVGLRVEQVLADGRSPAHASFGLHRRLGCWWLHL